MSGDVDRTEPPTGSLTSRRGAAPLAQTRVLAPLLRQVIGLSLSLDHEHPAVDDLIANLGQGARILSSFAPQDASPRRMQGESGRLYLDHSRDIAGYNPCFPEFALTEVSGDDAAGVVTFRVPFEGPPGVVHGGFLSLFFDSAVQEHNCALGIAGKTVSLHVDFLLPAPLGRPLTFALHRQAEGRRSTTMATLTDDRTPCSRATVVTVVGDRSRLSPVADREIPS